MVDKNLRLEAGDKNTSLATCENLLQHYSNNSRGPLIKAIIGFIKGHDRLSKQFLQRQYL